jgi:ABC-type multidrug transport system fused ATPase/permease subunit
MTIRKLRKQSNLQQHLNNLKQSLSIYQYCGRAVSLVWSTNRTLTVALALLALVSGLLPAAIAYVGRLIVDGVIYASQTGLVSDRWKALSYLGIEAALVTAQTGSQRGIALCKSLLRMQLGQAVNVLILEKALTLDMAHFEDADFYDKMSRAQRGASTRPLSLIDRTFGIMQSILSLIGLGGLLLNFSIWAVLILMVAAAPTFIAETRFALKSFRLFNWRAPESREQSYLEVLISREDSAMEVKLYQLGQTLLNRYHAVFNRLYEEDRNLTIRRSIWTHLLSLVSTAAFYGAYLWIVLEAISKRISLGDLTMYLSVFRQGQTIFSNLLSTVGGMYEDSLYLSNLYEFLEQEIPQSIGRAMQGTRPGDGLRFEHVSFAYPNSADYVLKDISLHLNPGQKLAIVGENGSGKTTLIKLLTRLYPPVTGRILLDGLDLQEWDINRLQQRIGVIFQNFVKYQFTVGENIGAGDVRHLEEENRWRTAAKKGTANTFIETMPQAYQTRLGKWFKGGRELSGGQWQKIALSRAFMRSSADILVLDEPTSAMDAEAEMQIFNRFRSMTREQMAILISHRFSTVRMADQIVVLSGGKVVEQGTHEQLLKLEGRYSQLFYLQASGYQ